MTGSSSRGLAALVDSVRRKLRRGALVAAAVWLAAVIGVGLAVAWIVAPEGWSGGSSVPLVLDLGMLVVVVACAWVVALRLGRRLDDPRLAGDLDAYGGLGPGSVLGALELSRGSPPGTSPSLARKAEGHVLDALPSDPDPVASSLGEEIRVWRRRGVFVLAVAACVVVGLVVGDPGRAADAWRGLLSPTTVLATPARPLVVLEPGTDSLPRGTEGRIVTETPGRDRVRLRWQFDGDVARNRDLLVDGGRVAGSIGALDAPVDYRLEAADGTTTSWYRLTPLDPLLVTDLRVELLFPPHTGLAPRQFVRDVPPLSVPVGTRVRVRGRASRVLRAASLRRVDQSADSVVQTLEVEGDRFSGEWRPVEDGRYAWTLRADGPEGVYRTPDDLEVTLVPDSVPTVELLFPGRDTVLPLDRRQPLVIRGHDDYGIAALELVTRRVSSTGEADDPVVEELRPGGIRSAVARPVLDLSGWDLLPGDTVRYRVTITDNAPRPHTGRTREFVLRVPRRTEAERSAQRELDAAAELVDSLRAEAERAARETRELERSGVRSSPEGGLPESPSQARERSRSGSPEQAGAQDQASFEARQDARRMVERQAGLLDRADSIRARLERVRRALEEGVLAESELREDLEELEGLIERATPPEMRDGTRELSERLGEMDSGELEQALERMAASQEELRRQLEESLERFRRAAADQDFRTTAREAREIAREEQALSDALESGDRSPRRSEQQAGLTERSRRLQERMEALEERLGEMEEEEARRGVSRARETSERAVGTMERTAEMLSRGSEADAASPSAAGDSARQAYQDLQRAADDLDRAREEMGRRRDEERRRALRQAASEALDLARRQAELQEQLGERDAGGRDEAPGDQAAILEGLRNLEANLSEASAGESRTDEELRQAAERAGESVQRALQAVQEPSGATSRAAASTEAVEALNELARSASRSSRTQQGGGSQAQQSSGGQTGQQLQELARRQAGLSDQSGALQSMQLGRASMEPQLRQIAGEQGRLGRELGQLSVRPGANGQVLGDLRSLAREARDLARELEGGRLDSEIVRRQERLFHRLLDAGRSLENDEFSTERESRSAGTPVGPEIEALTIEDVGGGRFPLPSAEVLGELAPAQRAMVIRYFERLNRTEAPSPPGGAGDGP